MTFSSIDTLDIRWYTFSSSQSHHYHINIIFFPK